MGDSDKPVLPRIVTEVPGPKSRRLAERYRNIFGERGAPTIAVEKGLGCIKEDVDGNRFLDFAQSLCAVGYSNPDVI